MSVILTLNSKDIECKVNTKVNFFSKYMSVIIKVLIKISKTLCTSKLETFYQQSYIPKPHIPVDYVLAPVVFVFWIGR